MSKDYRMSFVKDVEALLSTVFQPEQITMISNAVIKAMDGYEVTERCTDLEPLDDTNTKIIKRFRACLMVDGKSEKTIYQYTRTIARFVDAIRKPLTTVGAYDIRFFIAMEQERGLSARSRENLRANLSAFFQWMADDDLIDKNPIAKLKPIKYPDEVRLPFSDVELDALRGACKTKKERAIIEMLISTGVRVNELANMEITDINFDELSVHVVHGKGAKERMTYTTAVSAKYVLDYLNNRKEESKVLFCNKNHDVIGTGGIRYILNQIATMANVKNCHPHRFRRTFATSLAKRGMEIQEIKKLLGHSSIDTTMTYIVMNDKKTQAEYSKYIA